MDIQRVPDRPAYDRRQAACVSVQTGSREALTRIYEKYKADLLLLASNVTAASTSVISQTTQGRAAEPGLFAAPTSHLAIEYPGIRFFQ
jgi:hypothetical protein